MKMQYEKEDFKTSIDWITYKVRGKTPDYLKRSVLKFYPTHGKIPNRGAVHVSGKKTSLCSCYDHEFPEVEKEFMERYDGKNLHQLQREFRSRYNLSTGRAPITRLADCNISFTSKRKDGRLDAITAMRKKRYNLCRCYINEKDEVAADFNRMKKEPGYDIRRIQDELKMKYNLRNQKRLDDSLISD